MRHVAAREAVAAGHAGGGCHGHASCIPDQRAAGRGQLAHGIAAIGIRAIRSALRLEAVPGGAVGVVLAAAAPGALAARIASERRIAACGDGVRALGQARCLACRGPAHVDVRRRVRSSGIADRADGRGAGVAVDASVRGTRRTLHDGHAVGDRVPWRQGTDGDCFRNGPGEFADRVRVVDPLTDGRHRARIGSPPVCRTAEHDEMRDVRAVLGGEDPGVRGHAGGGRHGQRVARGHFEDRIHQAGRNLVKERRHLPRRRVIERRVRHEGKAAGDGVQRVDHPRHVLQADHDRDRSADHVVATEAVRSGHLQVVPPIAVSPDRARVSCTDLVHRGRPGDVCGAGRRSDLHVAALRDQWVGLGIRLADPQLRQQRTRQLADGRIRSHRHQVIEVVPVGAVDAAVEVEVALRAIHRLAVGTDVLLDARHPHVDVGTGDPAVVVDVAKPRGVRRVAAHRGGILLASLRRRWTRQTRHQRNERGKQGEGRRTAAHSHGKSLAYTEGAWQNPRQTARIGEILGRSCPGQTAFGAGSCRPP